MLCSLTISPSFPRAFKVTSEYVRVAEQNFEDWQWEEGKDYARELRATVDSEGRYRVHDDFEILGWMIQSENDPNVDSEISATRQPPTGL